MQLKYRGITIPQGPSLARHRPVNITGALLLFALLLLPMHSAKAGESVEVAIFPYLSVHQLLSLYDPLRRHLEDELERPVRLVTSRDFASFIADTHQTPYTLLINAPHMARLAEEEAGYNAILRPEVSLYPVVVVQSEDPLETLSDLRGAHIATPFGSAVITMMAREILGEAGLEEGRDVHFVHAGSHNNAVEEMLNNPQVRAAIVSNPAFGVVSTRYQGRVERLMVDRAERGLSPVVYLAGPGLSATEQERLATILLEFANQDAAGKAMMEQARHQGLRPFTPEDRLSLDAYLPATREAFTLP